MSGHSGRVINREVDDGYWGQSPSKESEGRRGHRGASSSSPNKLRLVNKEHKGASIAVEHEEPGFRTETSESLILKITALSPALCEDDIAVTFLDYEGGLDITLLRNAHFWLLDQKRPLWGTITVGELHAHAIGYRAKRM